MLGGLDQIGVNLEGEGSKMAVIDAAAVKDLFFDVFSEGLDDEVELGFGIERFD